MGSRRYISWNGREQGLRDNDRVGQQIMQFLLLQQHSVTSSELTAQAGHHCACLQIFAGSDHCQQQVTLSIDKQETKQVTSFRQAYILDR